MFTLCIGYAYERKICQLSASRKFDRHLKSKSNALVSFFLALPGKSTGSSFPGHGSRKDFFQGGKYEFFQE